MRIAVVGAGFWAAYQIAAWREISGVEVVGVCDPVPGRAERFGIPSFADPDRMLDAVPADLVDVITPPETHGPLVHHLVGRGLPIVCQKPMADSLEEARGMVQACRQAGVPFFVHENWRFQTPLQRVKALLPRVGRPFRARLQFSCSFPVFDNQPFLGELERFILADIGSHILDAARFLFGEATAVTAVTSRINPTIRGEDVATVLLRMTGCDAVVCEMSYASRLRDEAFPQTFAIVEGSEGSIELRKGYRLFTPGGEEAVEPARYAWADPAYDLVHSSVVACQRAILDDLAGGVASGVRGEENLRTVELVSASYRSAEEGKTVSVNGG